MNQHIPFKRIAIAGLGAAFMSAGASALADPPSRVARLAYVSGPVSFAPAGDNLWETAALNRPLIPGDRLWVEPGARDEVQVSGAALRMGGGTLVTLLNNDDRVTQLQLSQGRLNVHVRRMRPNDVFEIDTPNLALSIRQPGDYRIEVDPNGNATMVAVRRGQAEAYGDGNAYRLASGQAYSFGGTDLRDARYARPLLDEFDRWADSRDRRIEQSRSVRYVSQDLIGYEDLDDQGTWRVVPNYGNVWMPQHVSRDWAPYRDGHWSYVQPWGWTWVDDAPWGYAVSHYGRWARFNDGWGWVPGPRASSPVYAPALVAFVNIGSGSYAPRERPVAWFPLAPREVYRPSYRASPNYINNINTTNTVVDRRDIGRDGRRGDYANRGVRGAVTAVPANAFVQAQPVSRAAMAVPVAALAAAAISHNAPVAPERESMRGHRGEGNRPPQAVMERQVLARNAPPRVIGQTPMPQQQSPQAAAVIPAPRMLPQDRRGNRQFGQLPPQGAAPMVQPQQPVAPVPANAREARRDEMRQMPHNMPPVASPQPGQVAPVPVPAQQVQANERDARREQMRQHGQREAEQAQAAQRDQQARMQQQARDQEQRGRAQQQEQQARMQQQQVRDQEQRGRAQQQEQQARMQQQARDQEQQKVRQAHDQEQQARTQQQARDQEQQVRTRQAHEQEQQARMQQQTRDQEQQGRARQAHEQEQQVRMQQQVHAQEQARAQQQAHAQEQAQARAQAQAQAQAAQAAAQAQASQARAQAQAQAAQAHAAQAQAQQAAASAPPPAEHGHGRGREGKKEKEQQN